VLPGSHFAARTVLSCPTTSPELLIAYAALLELVLKADGCSRCTWYAGVCADADNAEPAQLKTPAIPASFISRFCPRFIEAPL
jgi:hypothetical protein